VFFGVSHPRLAHRSPFVPKPPKTLLRWKISGGKFVAPPPSIFSITPHKTHTPASSIIQLRRRLALVIVGKSKSTVWSSYTRKNHVGTLYLASGLPSKRRPSTENWKSQLLSGPEKTPPSRPSRSTSQIVFQFNYRSNWRFSEKDRDPPREGHRWRLMRARPTRAMCVCMNSHRRRMCLSN
jgi:hypothetical protein